MNEWVDEGCMHAWTECRIYGIGTQLEDVQRSMEKGKNDTQHKIISFLWSTKLENPRHQQTLLQIKQPLTNYCELLSWNNILTSTRMSQTEWKEWKKAEILLGSYSILGVTASNREAKLNGKWIHWLEKPPQRRGYMWASSTLCPGDKEPFTFPWPEMSLSTLRTHPPFKVLLPTLPKDNHSLALLALLT